MVFLRDDVLSPPFESLVIEKNLEEGNWFCKFEFVDDYCQNFKFWELSNNFDSFSLLKLDLTSCLFKYGFFFNHEESKNCKWFGRFVKLCTWFHKRIQVLWHNYTLKHEFIFSFYQDWIHNRKFMLRRGIFCFNFNF